MADLFIATVPHPVSEQAVFQPALRQYLSNHFDSDTINLPPFSPGEATLVAGCDRQVGGQQRREYR
jgi:hypothetical protein